MSRSSFRTEHDQMKPSVIGGAAFLLSGGVALAVVALIGGGTPPVAGASALEIESPAPQVTTENAVVFSVPDMHCEFACAPAVREALAAVPGVQKVETDVEKQTATVYVGGAFDESEALAVLAGAGYPGKVHAR